MADDQEIIFHFGRFRGKSLEDIPSDYLKWVLNQDWFEEKYVEYATHVESELKFRDVWHTHFYEND